MPTKYVRSPELEALRAKGITKWSELEKHGIRRCYCTLWNSKTKKHRQCRREATVNGCCSIHAPMMQTAEEMNRAALDADKKSNEEWNKEMEGGNE